MSNPEGLVFRFSNYDVIDELGRNFAFTSQDINDRTGALVLDFGGFDSDNDGRGDSTEIHRVATGIGTRFDSNGDGIVDDSDRKRVFDETGKAVGITLREALGAIGLTAYDERVTPFTSLTPDQIANSYSTMTLVGGMEVIFRIRRTKIEMGTNKVWEIIDPTGVDHTLKLDERIIKAGDTINLSFFLDADRDGLPAVLEAIHSCSDQTRHSDAKVGSPEGDGLDDRFEVRVGWMVNTDRGERRVYSRCSTMDGDNDGLTDAQEAPAKLNREDGLILFDEGVNPTRDLAGVQDPALRALASPITDPGILATMADPITDPNSKDTDLDGLSDKHEQTAHTVTLRDGGTTNQLVTSAEMFDTDGDIASDGLEEKIGGNPLERRRTESPWSPSTRRCPGSQSAVRTSFKSPLRTARTSTSG